RDRELTHGVTVGVMVESNLCCGKQPITTQREQLQYGVSITDGCIDWETTERMLEEGYSVL
ncbi:MAG: 3-deoxy-7-phosphoheptulonate synthase, partial [bacterium]